MERARQLHTRTGRVLRTVSPSAARTPHHLRVVLDGCGGRGGRAPRRPGDRRTGPQPRRRPPPRLPRQDHGRPHAGPLGHRQPGLRRQQRPRLLAVLLPLPVGAGVPLLRRPLRHPGHPAHRGEAERLRPRLRARPRCGGGHRATARILGAGVGGLPGQRGAPRRRRGADRWRAHRFVPGLRPVRHRARSRRDVQGHGQRVPLRRAGGPGRAAPFARRFPAGRTRPPMPGIPWGSPRHGPRSKWSSATV